MRQYQGLRYAITAGAERKERFTIADNARGAARCVGIFCKQSAVSGSTDFDAVLNITEKNTGLSVLSGVSIDHVQGMINGLPVLMYSGDYDISITSTGADDCRVDLTLAIDYTKKM